ncbi:hypothetical protein, partial [Salmonella sp. SAL4360]|uniref:hypothetical protein n=1 Tax=Salmonella sp. SAL4360 TaxID=3159881 RepID=UPI00397A88E3
PSSLEGDDAGLQDIVTSILIAGHRRVGVTAVDGSTAKSVVAARLGEMLALVDGDPPSQSTIKSTDRGSVLEPGRLHASEHQT